MSLYSPFHSLIQVLIKKHYFHIFLPLFPYQFISNLFCFFSSVYWSIFYQAWPVQYTYFWPTFFKFSNISLPSVTSTSDWRCLCWYSVLCFKMTFVHRLTEEGKLDSRKITFFPPFFSSFSLKQTSRYQWQELLYFSCCLTLKDFPLNGQFRKTQVWEVWVHSNTLLTIIQNWHCCWRCIIDGMRFLDFQV